MGILVVLAIGGLAYRYFQRAEDKLDQASSDEVEVVLDENGTIAKPAHHTVLQGENLWEIAEKYYQSGYNWVDIAETNNLANPDGLLIGQELLIPDVEPREATIAELPETGQYGPEIIGNNYIVQESDTLSKIAARAYGDMFAWPKIWSANRDKVGNPNLIYSGIELEIPRD